MIKIQFKIMKKKRPIQLKYLNMYASHFKFKINFNFKIQVLIVNVLKFT